MEHAIWSQGLTRRFGKTKAVADLDLQVREGAITAFLGPNGAGKTTTISLLLGLLKIDSGACEVLGQHPGHPAALAQIGALVESPSLYDHLTGLENLEITRLMRDIPRSSLDRVLKLVDLARDARRPVREYSLGMRQRLGMALALLGEPRLLILDEPTNGLDPAGIQDMRELIRSLPKETGASVFLSSHLLAEVEQVAEDLVVIHRGKLRYQGPTEGLGSPGDAELVVRVGDLLQAQAALESLGFPTRVAEGRVWIQAPATVAPRIAACLVEKGCPLYELAPHKANLEARFLTLLEEA
ncbi:ABC transporter ATP-binding protein [Geothrix edaphica]|uniref:Bacitracin ABC transporter ATP-binding protein n=1 Tax=Geothrix edaphica TaxID=2927976 RepID=A0ABQ5PUQ1_9BACT|nr:ATP-binding cassette domain-containing protein [Geothrix edaphica]GLH66083.1 bacitracin ABC transporter ATP-binding protein [Geothrix edaphica]